MPRNHLTIVWSPKGGAGVTTTTALLALGSIQQAVVTSFDADLACVLGQTPDTPRGLASWINMAKNPEPLSQHGIGISNYARFVPPGVRHSQSAMPNAGTIASRLQTSGSNVILDCGGLPFETIRELAALAYRSILVVRSCYLTLRRCAAIDIRSTDVILVNEQGRALRRSDVEASLAKPVSYEIPLSHEIARVTDAGLLQARHTRFLRHSGIKATD